MIYCAMKLQFAFIYFFSSFSSLINGQDVVGLSGARILGTTMTTRNGRNISAFLGVPYAMPPVSQRRFRNAVSWKPQRPGDRFLRADKDGNDCPQLDVDGKLIGDEDCLVLNVYTPNIITGEMIGKEYPVMVYFHGANFFVRGSGSSINAGPEYLLDRDIVLVTVNYRLGALGFLSTGDEQSPGNFGLKDQILALEWIQENIISFAGDPGRVTIFGQCGGAASTSLHAMFAPEYLFSQYISQSGNALSFWAVQEPPFYTHRSYQLGERINCPTENSKILIECLRTAKLYDLVDTEEIFKDGNEWSLLSWGPTVEKSNIGDRYITGVPLHHMIARGMKDRPAIIGSVFDEALISTAAYYTNDTLYNSMKDNLLDYLTYVVKIFFDPGTPQRSARNAQKYYFGNATDRNSFIQNMTNLLSDAVFQVPLDLQMRFMAYLLINNVYLYNFDYRGTFSRTSFVTGNNDDIGVTHGDDLNYLFPVKTANVTLTDSDNKMIDIMIDFWTSFAHTGTPSSNHISNTNVWKPFIYDEGKLLKIGDNSDPTDFSEYPLVTERVLFWERELATQLAELFLTVDG